MASSSASSFEARVDALYAAPLDEFVVVRKRLAGELKNAGSAVEARSFLGLAKPTLSAWLTNQTTRRVPDLVRELLVATDAVAVAQRNRPGASADFPAAVAAQRRIVARLTEQARAIVAELGPGGAAADAVERVENNFRWGAIAGADREVLSRGRLVRDVVAPGFGGFGDAVADEEARPGPPPKPARHLHSVPLRESEREKPAPADAKADARREAQSARARARAAAEAEREHKRVLARQEAALREARSQTVRARSQLARAERDRAAAAQRVEAAEAELATVRADRDAAEERRHDAAEAVASCEAAEENLRRREAE